MQGIIFVVLLVTLSPSFFGKTQTCDPRYCRCAKDAGPLITVKCTTIKIEDLKSYIPKPSLVSSLDLSSNEISYLPGLLFGGFNNLVNLSLANNQITVIGNQSLEGLTSLQSLNLTNNKLMKWLGNTSTQTPKLRIIDVTGNAWLPSDNVLQSVQNIKGANWSKMCTQCTLVRNFSYHGLEDFQAGEFYRGKEGKCRAMKYTVSNQLKKFTKYGFHSPCFESGSVCYRTLVTPTPIHRCWDMDNYILNIQFILGPIALVLNLVVVVNTILTPKLHTNAAMVLVCNIALSDSCLSLYSILITSIRKIPYVKFYVLMESVCPCLGFMWLMAQIVTVMTLVFLTVERYLAIVYCMSPAARMRQKHAVRCVAFSWIVAIVIATLPVCGIGVYTANTYCIPLSRKKDIPHMYGLSIGISLGGMILYFITIPLYLRIYRFVKHNGLEGFNRADSSVARKISIMVMCNMFFFCFPVFIGLLWVSFHFTKGLDPIIKEIITGVIPTIAFTLNCLINPLLYAYKNKSFVHALQDRLELVRTKARAWSLSTNPSTPQRTCTENVKV